MTLKEVENEMQKLITEREQLRKQVNEINEKLKRLRVKKVYREQSGENFGKPRGKVAEMYGRRLKDLNPDELREYYTTMQREKRKRQKIQNQNNTEGKDNDEMQNIKSVYK